MNTDLGDPTVLKLLEQLTTMPGWLVAPSEPATVRDALQRCVPELIDGTLTIDACKPMLRLKGKECWATYDVTVHEVAGLDRDRIYAEQAHRYPGFAEYERQTAGIRTIPVLELKRT